MKIIQKTFDKKSAHELSKVWYGKNWPVVYILNNDKEAYIGETISISNRMKQHLENQERKMLKQTSIVVDDRFHKSAILDIEAKLIEYMSADNKYHIQNNNSGLRDHDYFRKKSYDSIFVDIWNDLRKKKITQHDINELKNSEIFKYTPYKRLTPEQYNAVYTLLKNIVDAVVEEKPSITIVNGEAGTGKTVIAMYLMKLFSDNSVFDFLENESEEIIEQDELLVEKIQSFKIGLVVPMTSLRATLRKVARSIPGLSAKMILGPNDVAKSEYDLLIVDESHRLYRRVGITSFGSYDNVNKALGLGKEATHLDWIMKQAKHKIFFYDETQTVRPSDIRKEDFLKMTATENYMSLKIQSQLRVLGGEDYIKYVASILHHKQSSKKRFKNYEFKLFDSISEMKKVIKEKDKEKGLSRLVAGFAWPWNTKGISEKIADKKGIYDIIIEDEKLRWNSQRVEWITSDNAINEVGSIHTIQGYDLNYVGVIIGSDMTYNSLTKKIEVNKESYYDTKGKVKLKNKEELETYILNVYKVLLTRGIHGTYVYVVDPSLREYFRRFI